MYKPFIRWVAFFAKELADIRRQPRLLLSLVLGPFLILLLFGVSFRGERPLLQTLLVVPPALENDPRVQQLQQAVNFSGFNVVGIRTDEATAVEEMQQSSGAIDLVEVIPDGLDNFLGRTEQTPIRILYSEIDPLQEQWVQYLSYVQIKELNTAFLLNAVGTFTAQINSSTSFVGEARADLQLLQEGLETAQSEEARQALARLRNNSGLFLAGLALATQDQQGQRTQTDVQALRADLQQLEQAINDEQIEQQQQRIASIDTRLNEVEQVAAQVQATPAEVIVSPLRSEPVNLVEERPDFVGFYAPGVLALLLQHMAVSMAALSLVREQLLGTTELFRVAPVTGSQIMLGKYAGFMLTILIIAAILIALLVVDIPFSGFRIGLGVPLVGDPLIFVGMVVLLIAASLGVGFVISSISKSESQAVQLTMLVLLASVFFSGFFLPLENFAPVVRYVSYGLPVAHGVDAFQALMLRGTLPRSSTIWWLGGIGLACFVLTLNRWQSNLRRR